MNKILKKLVCYKYVVDNKGQIQTYPFPNLSEDIKNDLIKLNLIMFILDIMLMYLFCFFLIRNGVWLGFIAVFIFSIVFPPKIKHLLKDKIELRHNLTIQKKIKKKEFCDTEFFVKKNLFYIWTI